MTEPWHATLSRDSQTKVWYGSETNFSGPTAEASTTPAPVAKLGRPAPEPFELDLHPLED